MVKLLALVTNLTGLYYEYNFFAIVIYKNPNFLSSVEYIYIYIYYIVNMIFVGKDYLR